MCSDHRCSVLSAVIDRMKTTQDRILEICAFAFERGEPCHLEILFLLLRASSFFITYLLVNFISIWLTHILKITAPFQKIVLVPKRFVQHVAVLICQSSFTLSVSFCMTGGSAHMHVHNSFVNRAWMCVYACGWESGISWWCAACSFFSTTSLWDVMDLDMRMVSLSTGYSVSRSQGCVERISDVVQLRKFSDYIICRQHAYAHVVAMHFSDCNLTEYPLVTAGSPAE